MKLSLDIHDDKLKILAFAELIFMKFNIREFYSNLFSTLQFWLKLDNNNEDLDDFCVLHDHKSPNLLAQKCF
jgi:hypothetical protein